MLKRSDPLAKKNAANNKKGVVGNTGRTTPIAPKPKNKKPNPMYIYFKIDPPIQLVTVLQQVDNHYQHYYI